uniref:Uncharacterized protein n=1 Tax=viral metagenome TaxID=1070528 RepID=A0A6M3IVC7_9ZZZZ
MGDNGDLKTQAEIAKEKSETPKAEVKEEIKKEIPPPPITDFKVCEIWIRSGKLHIDATAEFWSDRCRALGVMEYCKDIIKEAHTEPEKKIMPIRGNMKNFARNIFKRRK